MKWLPGFLVGVVFATATIICSVLLIPFPKAIDVYRGNTTLQITYRDSIPIDSIVVFKNK